MHGKYSSCLCQWLELLAVVTRGYVILSHWCTCVIMSQVMAVQRVGISVADVLVT